MKKSCEKTSENPRLKARELKKDVERFFEAIDEEIDSFIGTFNADTEIKRQVMRSINAKKMKELLVLSDELSKKWQIK